MAFSVLKPRTVEHFEAALRSKPIFTKPIKVRPIITLPINSIPGEPMTPSSIESKEGSPIDVAQLLEKVAARFPRSPKVDTAK